MARFLLPSSVSQGDAANLPRGPGWGSLIPDWSCACTQTGTALCIHGSLLANIKRQTTSVATKWKLNSPQIEPFGMTRKVPLKCPHPSLRHPCLKFQLLQLPFCPWSASVAQLQAQSRGCNFASGFKEHVGQCCWSSSASLWVHRALQCPVTAAWGQAAWAQETGPTVQRAGKGNAADALRRTRGGAHLTLPC